MLWTDSIFTSTADLMTIDPEVSDVAIAQNITVDGPSGIGQRTIEECGQLLLAQMQRFGGYLSSGLVSANHLAAVFNVGGPGINRTRVTLGQIVAYDPFVPVVKNWVLFKALHNFYRAATARTTEDRYKRKMDMYLNDTRQVYWPNLKNVGLPIVYRPMNAPGAVNERHSGKWGQSNVTYASKLGAAGGTFDVAITYVDQNFYRNAASKYNAESALSAIVTVDVPADNVISITLDGLIPPNAGMDASNIPQALVTPLNATGWNIYVGATGGQLYLQNAAPIPTPPLGSTTYYGNSGYANTIPISGSTPQVLAADPTLSGIEPDSGQFADAYYTVQDMLQRQ